MYSPKRIGNAGHKDHRYAHHFIMETSIRHLVSDEVHNELMELTENNPFAAPEMYTVHSNALVAQRGHIAQKSHNP